MYVEVPSDLIESGKTINYRNIEKASEVAERLFDSRYGQGEFCKRAEGITIKMMPHWWECSGSPDGCAGEYLSFEGRIKVISGFALLHEFIHAQETYLAEYGTLWHEDWENNGQYLLAGEYEAVNEPWWN